MTALTRHHLGAPLTMRLALAVLTALLLAAVPASAAVPSAEGNLLIDCSYDHTAPDDPIAFPGIPGGSPHQHDYFGVKGITAFTDTPDLLDKPNTCTFPSENVGVWHPQMVKPDGTKVDPVNVSIYYRKLGGSTDPVYPIPLGLRNIQGDSHNHDPAKYTATWACGSGAFTSRIPPATCTAGIFESIYTPQCWDGHSLDAPGHHTLVACTGSNIKLPSIQATFRWPAGTGGSNLESDLDEGVTGGITAHYDYFYAGDPFAWTKVIERCLNAGIQCRSVSNAFTKWPLGSIINNTTNADTPVLTAAEAKGLNP